MRAAGAADCGADVTLGFMAKLKPAGAKKSKPSHLAKPGVSGGLGCILLVVSTLLLISLLLYYSIARS
jgi:hypothetical protein